MAQPLREKLLSARPILESLAHLVVIAGIPLLAIEYHLNQEAAKVERTIQLVNSIELADSGHASFDLLEPWLEYDLRALIDAGLKDGFFLSLKHDLAQTNPKIIRSLYLVEGRMDLVAVCVESGACDRKTAESLLGASAHEIYCFYQPIYEEIDRKFLIKDFGSSTRAFAQSAGPCRGGT